LYQVIVKLVKRRGKYPTVANEMFSSFVAASTFASRYQHDNRYRVCFRDLTEFYGVPQPEDYASAAPTEWDLYGEPIDNRPKDTGGSFDAFLEKQARESHDLPF
jgi:hypothetical protein